MFNEKEYQREYQKIYRKKNAEKLKIYYTKWLKENKDRTKLTRKKWRDKNKDRIKKVNNDPIKVPARVLARKIAPQKCIFCEKLGQKHHPDYSKPLEVVFLCASHHKQLHNGTIKI